MPFEIPNSWALARLDNVVILNPRNNMDDDIKVSFVEMKSLDDGFKNHFFYVPRLWKDVKSGFTHFRDGDVGFAKITPCFQNRKSAVFCDLENCYGAGTTELHILRPYANTILSVYLLWYVKSPYFIEYGIQKFSGTAGQQRFGTDQVRKAFFPLPPLAEQERIVKRVEELFAYIDTIDNNQAELEKLYDDLKKRVLDLAIQGKLVSQEPSDEPASVLLEKIRAEKKAKLGKKYVDSFIYKGDDNCYYEKVGGEVKNITDILPFEIPDSWAWARLDSLCDYIHRGKSPVYGTEQILPIIAQKCNQWDRIHVDRCLFAEKKTIENYAPEQFLQPEDIIMNSTGTGTVGRTGLVDQNLFTNFPKFVADSHITVIRPNATCSSKYIYLFLISAAIQTDIEFKCSGSTNQIELATKTICNFLISVPPLKEQKQIVERIETLFENIKDED